MSVRDLRLCSASRALLLLLPLTVAQPSNAANPIPIIAIPSQPSPFASSFRLLRRQDNDDSNTELLIKYCFVFIGLAIILGILSAWLVYRRKRKNGASIQQRHTALQRDIGGIDAVRARRRYWSGRWHSTEVPSEEGLNENGEAPPPYIPKPRDEEEAVGHATTQLAVPMQVLTRQDVGLKPPDYSELERRSSDDAARSPSLDHTTPRHGD